MTQYFFDTRKEAREYCKKRGISQKKITDRRNLVPSAILAKQARWMIEIENPTFEVGKSYRLKDKKGFSDRCMANRIQAEDIEKYLGGVVKIKSTGSGGFVIERPVNGVLRFFTLDKKEIAFFEEVAFVAVPPKESVKVDSIGVTAPIAPVPLFKSIDLKKYESLSNFADVIENAAGDIEVANSVINSFREQREKHMKAVAGINEEISKHSEILRKILQKREDAIDKVTSIIKVF